MLKLLLKIFLGFVLFILIVLLLITGVYFSFYYYNEPLKDGYKEFFEVDIVPDEQNGFIELMGLVAPLDKDARKFGEDFLEKARHEYKTRIITYENLDKALANENMGFEFVNYEDLDQKTRFIGCWHDIEQGHEERYEDCLSENDVKELVSENAELLRRMRALNKYQYFENPKNIGISTTPFGKALMSLHQLELARITLLLQDGKYQEAVNGWTLLVELSQKLLNGRHDIIGQTVNLVNSGLVYGYSQILLNELPSAELLKYQASIKKALDFDVLGSKGYDVKKTMQTEHYTLISALSRGYKDLEALKYIYKDNVTRNGHYEYALDVVRLSKEGISDFDDKISILQKKYDEKYSGFNVWSLFSPNLLGDLVMPGLLKGEELIANVHRQNALIDSIEICLKAKVNAILSSDREKFILGNQGSKKYAEIDYLWDADKKVIYYHLPWGESFRQETLCK